MITTTYNNSHSFISSNLINQFADGMMCFCCCCQSWFIYFSPVIA